MGTKGIYVYKYKGIYYIFFSSHDSYLSCLGNSIVEDIKRIISNDQIKLIKDLIRCIPLTNGKYSEGDRHFPSIHDSIKYYDCYSYYTSSEEPGCAIFVEYVYIIDFDNNKFIVKQNDDNCYKFNLFNIPDNWIEILESRDSYDDKEENSDNEENSDDIENVEILDEDTDEDIKLKIKILEANIKIYKLKLKLNK